MNHNIEKYYNQVDEAIKNGLDHELNIKTYFYELLKSYTQKEGIKIDYEVKEYTSNNKIIYPDGRIKKENIIIGWIENKDCKDDLNLEIQKKINKGYPLLNTIFENSKELVLYQDYKIVDKINMRDNNALNDTLIKFVEFKPNEYKQFIDAFENLKNILPNLANELREFFIKEKKVNEEFKNNLIDFTDMCQRSININVSEEIAIEMIIQHMLTRDIFVMLFSNQNFHRNNIISNSIENILKIINKKSVEISDKINSYMNHLNTYISRITKDDKQDILKTFYSNFYKALNPKKADVQGIEYTPIEIVNFMVNACDKLLYEYFDKNLSSEGVNILDPCSGTGIFMASIINKINKGALKYKFKNELFSNEIDIMPYYIANLNIENAYYEKMNSYEIFDNMCFLDTLEFQITDNKTGFLAMEHFSSENLERAIKQYNSKINVIIGNPPYNANQKSENDNNKNKVYEDLDLRIKNTYIAQSKAQKTKQYDMYKRFIRWATDRIKSDDKGIIAFITNNAYLDSKQDDGFRKSVQKEFDYIYIIDLKGNLRKKDKSEGENVFNIQTGVAIMFLIKDPKIKVGEKKAVIKYFNVGDYKKRYDKLLYLMNANIKEIDFEDIIPNEKGQWLGQTNNDFYENIPLIDKNIKNMSDKKHLKKDAREEKAIFKLFSNGVLTARDDWAYDFDKKQLEKKIKYFIKVYDKEREKYADKKITDKEMNKNLDYSIKWVGDTKNYLVKNKELIFDKTYIRKCMYRPFVNSYTYFDYPIMQRPYQNKKIFPTEDTKNLTLNFNMIKPRRNTSCFVSDKIVDFGCTIEGEISVPLYSYESEEKKSNITEYALTMFKEYYSDMGGV